MRGREEGGCGGVREESAVDVGGFGVPPAVGAAFYGIEVPGGGEADV